MFVNKIINYIWIKNLFFLETDYAFAQTSTLGVWFQLQYFGMDFIMWGFMSPYHFIGLITTTARKLDREQQDEHILEVSISFFLIIQKIL